ncbi:MAG: hypothetical protein ACRDOI_41160, partial [Trebonia sp.]
MAERTRTGRPGTLSGPELAGARLAGRELALRVARRPLPGLPLPVSRLAGRPRLPLVVGTTPGPRPLFRTGPASTVLAGPVLAGPRLLRRVLAGAALALAGWHGARLARYPAGRPLLGELVSRCLPVRTRWPPGRRALIRLPRSARCLPREVLPRIPLFLLTARLPRPRSPGRPRVPRARRPAG